MEFAIKLALSAILGLAIGIEREMKHKPVGLKTYMIISVVCCLLTIVSIDSAYLLPKTDHINMDPMRLAAQIISGIGFLGAGVILRRNNDVVVGLTTAAMIWGASGIGIAVGAGYYKEAAIVTLIILLSVDVIPRLLKGIGPKTLSEKEIRLRLNVRPDVDIPELLETIRSKNITIKRVHILDKENFCLIDLHITVNEKRLTAEVYNEVKEVTDILSVEIENL